MILPYLYCHIYNQSVGSSLGFKARFWESSNASGMEANIQVLLIRKFSSHSSSVVNGLELPCLAATLCLYKTMLTKVVPSCAVDAKIIYQQCELTAALQSKIQPFLDILGKVHRPKYFLKVCS